MTTSIKTRETFTRTSNDTGMDMFKLQAQTLRAKTKGSSNGRQKEDSAVNQAMYIARKAGKADYNGTIATMKKEQRSNESVVFKDQVRFSGAYAFNNAFGNKEREIVMIKREMIGNITKTKMKKLKQQLKRVTASLKASKLIDQEAIEREISERDNA